MSGDPATRARRKATPSPAPEGTEPQPFHPLRELVLMRIRSYLREPEALFWIFGFPVLMALGLGLAFGGDGEEVSRVGVVRGSAAAAYLPVLRSDPTLDAIVLDPAAAELALRHGEIALLATGGGPLVYRFDPQRPESQTARLQVDAAVQRAGGARRPVPVREQRVRAAGSRYIDWVIPGIIGLNLMSTGMWGLGFALVTMRQKKQLKRLAATPMRRRDFLASQIGARLAFLPLEIAPVVLFAWLVFGVRVEGSLLALSVVVLFGATVFAGLGLFCSSRARTVEGVSGLLNLVMIPMFVLSGVFFSARRFPDAIQPLIQALPLTALNDALRLVYNDGAGLAAAGGELAILAAWGTAAFVLALRWFRWQ